MVTYCNHTRTYEAACLAILSYGGEEMDGWVDGWSQEVEFWAASNDYARCLVATDDGGEETL